MIHSQNPKPVSFVSNKFKSNYVRELNTDIKNLWPEVLYPYKAHSSEYFFSLIAWILINPVVSSGSKFSKESIEASS